jgi:hypothetical protein
MPQQGSKPARTWQDIAEEASRERDPKRLLELTTELEKAFEARDKKPPQSERKIVNE